MRILMVSEDIPHPQLGGLGRHVLALARELHARGHTVDLLGNADHPVSGLPGQGGPGRFIPGVTGHQRLYKEKQLGVFLPWRAGWNAAPLREAIVRHASGYDVIHYHGHLPWVAAALPERLPFIQTRHDPGGDCMLRTRYPDPPPAVPTPCRTVEPRDCAGCATLQPGALQRAVSAQAVRRMRSDTAAAYAAHPVLFVSDFLRQGFARSAGIGPPGAVVHNAVDAATLQAAVAAQPVERGAALEVFGAAALYAYKGFGELLRALGRAALPAGLRLTVAGDGPEMPRLRELAAGLPVRLLGWTAAPDVLRHTAAADAVIVPSLWDEPCATTVLEALALGRTVLALRRGGTPELADAAGASGGHLLLFDGLDELVRTLCGGRLPPPRPPAEALRGFRGTMAAMADAVLAHYERVQRAAAARA